MKKIGKFLLFFILFCIFNVGFIVAYLIYKMYKEKHFTHSKQMSGEQGDCSNNNNDMHSSNDIHNPYNNPGQDLVIDESYHGIDRGLGIANPDHIQSHNNNNSFGGSGNHEF